jgi:hypothetical protein
MIFPQYREAFEIFRFSKIQINVHCIEKNFCPLSKQLSVPFGKKIIG